MANMNIDDMLLMKEFLKLKRENPEEYKLFLSDLRGLMKDFKEILESS